MARRITQAKAWQVVGMWRAGRKQVQIARHFHLHQGTVSKIIKRYQRTRDVRPGTSTGRPRKTTAQEDRLLLRMCRRDRFKSANTLRDEWVQVINEPVSRSTVNRRLLHRGLQARRPAKKPSLTDVRRRTRLDWARQHSHLRLRHWRHVLFSDESRFLLHRADGRVRVRRERGQRFQDDCVKPTRAHGGGSVHVWGAFTMVEEPTWWFCTEM